MGRANRTEGDRKAKLGGTGRLYQAINMIPSTLNSQGKPCHQKPLACLGGRKTSACHSGWDKTLSLGQDPQLLPQPGRWRPWKYVFAPSLCFHLCLAREAAHPVSPERRAVCVCIPCGQAAAGPSLHFGGSSAWRGPGCAPAARLSAVSAAGVQRPSQRQHAQHCPDVK